MWIPLRVPSSQLLQANDFVISVLATKGPYVLAFVDGIVDRNKDFDNPVGIFMERTLVRTPLSDCGQ
jgi:hypothetical protein